MSDWGQTLRDDVRELVDVGAGTEGFLPGTFEDDDANGDAIALIIELGETVEGRRDVRVELL